MPTGSRPRQLRLTLLGVGAMNSPRYAPAGLLLEYGDARVMFDGGPGAEPDAPLEAWLVTDARAELRAAIRRSGRARGVEPGVRTLVTDGVRVEPYPVVHTSHPTCGYLIEGCGRRAAWAPEFLTFPDWAAGVDLLFADAAGWRTPIRFARGTGGHAAALDVSAEARRLGVRRLVFAHLGRPTLRAIDAGLTPPFGEFGREGGVFLLRQAGAAATPHARTPGHRMLPHTADLLIEAWGPSRNKCIEQAALGLVESFIDMHSAVASESVITDIPAMDDVELLITVLEEVIYVVDAKGMVPIAASLRENRAGGFRAVFAVTPLDDVTSIGPVPKAITRHAMHFGEDDGGWSCHVLVDV